MKNAMASILLLGAVACGQPSPPSPAIRLTASEERFADQIWVFGDQVQPSTDDWSLVTWPELAAVDTTATEPVEDAYGTWSFELVPTSPPEPRWYAVRWHGPPAEADVVSGIPLSDGSKVWRTYGVPLPEVVQLVAFDSGSIAVSFATDVWVEEGFGPDDVVQIDQGTCAPESHGADYADGFNYFELACTSLDWSAPITFEMGHVRSRDGLVMTPVTRVVTFSFAPGETMVGVRFPLSVSAPLVPAALCAGVSCE